MAIAVGDQLPQVNFRVMTADGPAVRTTDDVFRGRRVVLFAVPGAFTPGCHKSHLPGYIANAAAIKAKGVDAIAVTAVNDVFVMSAWAEASGAKDIEFLADGNGDFPKALGLELDRTGFGLGMRSQRYSMIVEDGVVKALNVEPAPGVTVSSAETMLEQLG